MPNINNSSIITNGSLIFAGAFDDFIETAPVEKLRHIRDNFDQINKISFKLGQGTYPDPSGGELTDRSYSAHPSIPKGYFDKLEGDKLLVEDSENPGTFIDKTTTYLTTEGLFVKRSILAELHRSERACATVIVDILRVKNGESASPSVPPHFYVPLGNGLVHKVKLDQLEVGIFYQQFGKLFRHFAGSRITGEITRESIANDFTVTTINSICNEIVMRHAEYQSFFKILVKPANPRYRTYTSLPCHLALVPDTSTYARNLIEGGAIERPNLLCDWSRNAAYDCLWISMNDGNEFARHTRSCAQIPNIDDLLPFNIKLKLSVQEQLETSLRTGNNDGTILGYTTRVPDFKAAFKMTDQEKEFCKVNKKIKPAFFGIELEYLVKKPIDPTKTKATFCKDLVKSIADSPFGDHCLMKSDASIGDVGFELVTIPASMNYHKKMFDEHFFKNGFDKKLMSAPSCGLHIHIGKDAFVPFDEPVKSRFKGAQFKTRVGKFITFLSLPENLPFIEHIAGRRNNSYCRPNPLIKKKSLGGSHQNIVVGSKISPTKGYTGFERRSIVNTTNPNTLEIRIFKSTTDRNAIFRRLEFCHALVEFVKVTSTKDLNIYHFLNFVISKDNIKNYPCLALWLSSKNYVVATKKKSKVTGKITKIYGPVVMADPAKEQVKAKA